MQYRLQRVSRVPHVSDQMRNASQRKLDSHHLMCAPSWAVLHADDCSMFFPGNFMNPRFVEEETRPDALAVPQVIFHFPTRGLVARRTPSASSLPPRDLNSEFNSSPIVL